MANYTRYAQRFFSKGLDLSHPVDSTPEGKYPFLQNVRSFQDGRFEARQGMTIVNSSALSDLNIHSITRLNDYVMNTFARFLGAGTNLYYGQTSFASVDSGYSGNPLSFVPYLPARSVDGYTYIGDSSRLRKINVSGTNYEMGIFPPNIIPTAELVQPLYTTPSITVGTPTAGDDSESPFNVASAWGNTGSSTTPALNPVGMPGRLVSVAISEILYISGTTGWALVTTTGGNPTQIVAGMRMAIGTGGGGTARPTGNLEWATVEEVHKAYAELGGVTVSQILYDSGTTGLCTIEPSSPMAGVTRNTLLEVGSEYVRVISVTAGNNGVSSFRCSTTGTHTAGNTITTPPSGNFWIYLTLTHAAGEYCWCDVQQFEINPGSKGGQGQVYNNYGVAYYNLGIAGNRPLTPDDYLHLSIWCDHPEYLIQGNLVLDVDSGTGTSHAATDGTFNAYSYTFKGSDLQQYISNLQTSDATRPTSIQDTLQAETNIEQITPIIPPSALGSGQTSTPVDVASTAASQAPLPVLNQTTSQMYTGASQWTELRIRVSDLVRVGADLTANLNAVHAIMISFVVSNNIYVSMAGMWAGGTYGPDTYPNVAPFIWRYRYRNSTTGAVSIPGPALRSGVTAYRQAVQLVATASGDAQVDKIDWERLGGSNTDVNGVPDWHYLGTCENSSPTIIDDQYDAAIVVNAPLDTSRYQPFTLSQPPVTVTATVAGTAILVTSGAVNVNMVVGTEILVNGILTELYAAPTSTTLFHVADSMGSGTGIMVEIQEPVTMNQPLPVMWGPFQNTIFACGNDLDVSSLYYTIPGDPDSSPDTNRISITGPSETLMNGFIFDSKCYAFSDKRLFQIVPSSGPNDFSWNEVYNNKGLASRWALAIGPSVWFLASDGIYEYGVNGLKYICDDIELLFPKGDRAGQIVNLTNGTPLYPVNMATSLRLTYHNSYLFFDYIDTNSQYQTLVYDTTTGGWYYDNYFSGSSPYTGIVCRYSEWEESSTGQEAVALLVGTNRGKLCTASGTSDLGAAISCEVDTACYDAGDPRPWKLLGDWTFDANTNGQTVACTADYNNYTIGGLSVTFISNVRGFSSPFTFPLDLFVRNLGLKFVWVVTPGQPSPQLFTWDVSFLIRPEDINDRPTDWDAAGYQGNKFFQGFVLEANTYGQTKTVQLWIDYVYIQTFQINHNGQQLKPYVLDPAFTGHMARLIPID